MKSLTIVSLRVAVSTAATLWLLAGCGLAETAAVAGAQGASAAEQAKQAKEAQAKIEADVAAAQAEHADALKAAEEATQ